MPSPGEHPPAPDAGIGPAPTVDTATLRAKAKVAHALFGEPAPADIPYSKIDRYEIDSRLGSGAMGVVYQAWDPQLERPVAIKVLHSDVAQSPKARQRLTREARSLARLSHPNVVQVYDVGTDADRVYVAMELVDGQTLTRWITEGNPRWPQVLAVFVEAAQGLAAAHQAGLVHRDLKPDNILIGHDSRVRVLDFGLVRISEPPATDEDNPAVGRERSPAHRRAGALAPDTTLTETGTVVGTPLYMAPELLLDGCVANAASDQYSFCVTLYEALYRRRPFAGTALPVIAANISEGKVLDPPPDSEVPGRLFALVRRGLAKDPERRWPNMRALLEQLDAVKREVASPPAASSSRRSGWFVAIILLVLGGAMAATWGLR